MKVTPMNIFRHELVGLTTEVVASRDSSQIHRKGTIIDESKEMLILETKEGKIMLPKEVCIFDLGLPDGTIVRIDGNLLRGRPEERLKKRLSRRW